MSTTQTQPEYITAEKVNALNIPDELKAFIIGCIGVRPRAEKLRRGALWNRFLATVLVNFYGDYRSEWSSLFDKYGKKYEPVKGVYDPLNKVTPSHRRSDFVAKPCENCTTKEMEAFEKTGKLPERLLKGKKVKDIVDARIVTDVLEYFHQDDQTKMITSMKAYAKSIGVDVHENTKKPEKIANMILDAVDAARDEVRPKEEQL